MRRRYTIIISAIVGVLILIGAYFAIPTIFGSVLVPLPDEYREMLVVAAKKYNVDSCLGAATIKIESNWNPNAHSGSGAVGLGQIISGTFRSIGSKNGISIWKGQTDPETNINVMMAYHHYNINLYGNDLRNIAVAYNGGGGLVSAPDSRLPLETRFYIKKLKQNYDLYSAVYPEFCTGPAVEGGPAVGGGGDIGPVFKDFTAPSTPQPIKIEDFWKAWVK